MARMRQFLATALVPLLAGCGGSGSRSVTLEVTTANGDGSASPVRSAYVRVIPTQTSPVPLPINSTTLQELKGIKQDADFTDDRGRVTLAVTSKRPFNVEVAEALMIENPTGQVWVGSFDPTTGELTPRTGPEAVNVRIVR